MDWQGQTTRTEKMEPLYSYFIFFKSCYYLPFKNWNANQEKMIVSRTSRPISQLVGLSNDYYTPKPHNAYP